MIVEVSYGDRGDLDMHVDSVLERPRQFGSIEADLLRGTDAFTRAIPLVAAGIRIHRGDQHEERRVAKRAAGPGHGHMPVFQWLP